MRVYQMRTNCVDLQLAFFPNKCFLKAYFGQFELNNRSNFIKLEGNADDAGGEG